LERTAALVDNKIVCRVKSNPELAAFIVRIFPVEDVLNDLGFFISNFYNTGFEKRYVAHY